GVKTDGENTVEVEGRADLGRDLLDDADFVALARKLVVERVDDLLIVDHLVAYRRLRGRRCHGSALAPRLRLAHGEDAIDVSGTQLENTAHAGHRGDRLEFDVHLVEQRAALLRMVVLDFEIPLLKGPAVANDDRRERVFAHVAMGLVEELVRQGDVILVDIPDLRYLGHIGDAGERTGHDRAGNNPEHGRFDLVRQHRSAPRGKIQRAPRAGTRRLHESLLDGEGDGGARSSDKARDQLGREHDEQGSDLGAEDFLDRLLLLGRRPHSRELAFELIGFVGDWLDDVESNEVVQGKVASG